MKPLVNLYKLGRLPYLKALNFQRILADSLKKKVVAKQNQSRRLQEHNSQPFENGFLTSSTQTNGQQFCIQPPCSLENSLILVEHEPVYTVGIRFKQYDDNFVSKLKSKLAEQKLKADFVHTNRGGLITFHGPGQLVAYPIIYLGDFPTTIGNRSVKTYVNILQATIIDTLARVGLEGAHTVKEYPGVWLDNGERKIAFVGISCQNYVTMHGIAINCDCDLSWYDHIVSCGIEDKSITSIRQELLTFKGVEPGLEFKQQIKSTAFNNDLHDISPKNTTIGGCELEGFETDNHPVDKCRVESYVDHVSKMFCLSFSDHFDCKLVSNSQDSWIAKPEALR